MKHILLLAAAACPLLMTAQVKSPAGPVILYNLPAGTFYTPAYGTTPVKAILPPSSTLTWPNVSFYYDEPLQTTVGLQTYYQWTYDIVDNNTGQAIPTVSSDSTLITNPEYTALTPFIAPVKLPTLSEVDTEDSYTSDATAYVGSSSAAPESYLTYNPMPSGMTIKKATLPQFTIGTSDLTMEWSAEYDEIEGPVIVSGFGQLIEYGGCPYTLSGITLTNASEFVAGEGFTVSIYRYPGTGNPLPAEPIYTQEYSSPGGKVASIDMTLDGVLTVTEPIVVTFTNVSAISFAPDIAVAVQERYYPVPANQGLFAVASYTEEGAAVSDALLPWTTPVGSDTETAIPVAMDLRVNMSYNFFKPIYVTSEDRPFDLDKDFTINFNPILNEIDFRCVSSTTDASQITVSQPDGSALPDWLDVKVSSVDPASEEVKALAKEFGITESITPRYVNLVFMGVKAINSEVEVKVSVPDGSYATFTVKSSTSGIDTVESDSPVTERQYFDLAGRRLEDAPSSGFFIERAIRADGTTTSTSRVM